MDDALQWITTKEGHRFDIGEVVKSGTTRYIIIGFGYNTGKLWFYVKPSDGGGLQGHTYLYANKPQFHKIEPNKPLKPEKEKPGLYFDRVKGFEIVEDDAKSGAQK